MMMLDDCNAIGTNQCLSLPKAELKTKNSTKRQLCCRLVKFLVFNSICLKISVTSKGRNRSNQWDPLGEFNTQGTILSGASL